MAAQETTPPLPNNGMGKFGPSLVPCDPGVPVEDAATLFSGDPCCSACRGLIEVVDNQWVHRRQS